MKGVSCRLFKGCSNLQALKKVCEQRKFGPTRLRFSPRSPLCLSNPIELESPFGFQRKIYTLRANNVHIDSSSHTPPSPPFPNRPRENIFHDVLRLVRGCGNIASPARPVDVMVLTGRVLCVGVLGLDHECVGAKVVALRLQQVCRQVLGAVAVVEAECGAEGRGRDAPQRALADGVAPARLRLVDGLIEEIVEQQVLQVRVLAVRGRDVLEEDGADDAAATPHKSDRGFVELPAVFLGGLWRDSLGESELFSGLGLTFWINMNPWAYEMIFEA